MPWGPAKDFNVIHLSGWMFSFSVSCKDMGFMIYGLKSFCCKSFAAYFHLWGGGGPNWHREFALWRLEQESKWTTVGSKLRESFADVVRSSSVPKHPVFLRLRYPDNYYENFGVLASNSNRNPGVSSPDHKVVRPKIPTMARNKRVLRWIAKSNFFKPTPFKVKHSVDLNKVPSQERSSPSHTNPNPPNLAASKPLSASSPAQRPSNGSVSGPTQRPSNEVYCFKCLGPGHTRKACTQSVRCICCFNYGHTSLFCLSRNRAQRRYRVVSCSEGEGTHGAHLYSGDPPFLSPPSLPNPLSHLPPQKTLVLHLWQTGRLIPSPHADWLHVGGTGASATASPRSLHHWLLHPLQ